MATEPRVVIISGPPGAGKTTVASALATRATRGFHLESDWFYRSVRSGFVAPHLPEAHQQNTAMIDAASRTAGDLARSGYLVVWDGIVGPWFIERVRERLAADIALDYLILRPERESSLQRVRDRDAVDEVDGATIMYDQFADVGRFESHVVHSAAAVDAVLAGCEKLVDSGATRLDSSSTSPSWPVSVKGVIQWGDRFVVLRNERDEWELPGGRLELSDAGAPAALTREIREELGLEAEVGDQIDTWIYDVAGKRVLILTFVCTVVEPVDLTHSDEHRAVAAMTIAELEASTMPAGYLRSLVAASARRSAS